MYINHFFKYSACAQLIIAPFDNVVVGANLEACRLLGRDSDGIENSTIATLFHSCLPGFLRFAQELMERGNHWSDQLQIRGRETTFRIEVHGIHSTVGKQDLLHLTFNRADETDQLRHNAETEHYYRPGNNSSGSVALAFESLSREIASHWPCNRQQLSELTERQAILAHYDTGRHHRSHRPAVPGTIATRTTSYGPTAATQQPHARAKVLTDAELKALEIRNMIRALQQSQGRIFGPGGAAELLEVKPTTLSGRLRRHHIDRRWFLPRDNKQAMPLISLPTDVDIPADNWKTGTHA